MRIFELSGVSKHYYIGQYKVKALDEVSFNVEAGEFVSIVGNSGSGKSTLLHLLGCLDKPSHGSLKIFGRDSLTLTELQMAEIRSRQFGFIFQSYNLIATSNALENVSMSGLYAGISQSERLKRARELLVDFGLEDRLAHKPNQLSGGQQQRVAMSRALFHPNAVILADEPTGALDSKASDQFLSVLQDLNSQGRTVILITHNMDAARIARRMITIADGRVIKDETLQNSVLQSNENSNYRATELNLNTVSSSLTSTLRKLPEVLKTSLQLMKERLVRTLLTIFGVIAGVAAVIAIVAVGDGAKNKLLDTVSSLGSRLVIVTPDHLDRPLSEAPPRGLSQNELKAVLDIKGVKSATLEAPVNRIVSGSTKSTNTLVTAAHSSFPEVHDWKLSQGVFFTSEDELGASPIAVLGSKVNARLFDNEKAVDEVVVISNQFFRVVGVLESKGASPAGIDLDDVIIIPFRSAVVRLGQKAEAEYMMIKVKQDDFTTRVAKEATGTIAELRGRQEVSALGLDKIIETELAAKDQFTSLLSVISLISLAVGAVGITNITLIGVVERRKEIGLRKALGATQIDIAIQFMLESVLLAVLGGVLGCIIGVVTADVIDRIGIPVEISSFAALSAVLVSVLTGIIAGVLPALRSARLDPIVALSSS